MSPGGTSRTPGAFDAPAKASVAGVRGVAPRRTTARFQDARATRIAAKPGRTIGVFRTRSIARAEIALVGIGNVAGVPGTPLAEAPRGRGHARLSCAALRVEVALPLAWRRRRSRVASTRIDGSRRVSSGVGPDRSVRPARGVLSSGIGRRRGIQRAGRTGVFVRDPVARTAGRKASHERRERTPEHGGEFHGRPC